MGLCQNSPQKLSLRSYRDYRLGEELHADSQEDIKDTVVRTSWRCPRDAFVLIVATAKKGLMQICYFATSKLHHDSSLALFT